MMTMGLKIYIGRFCYCFSFFIRC